MFIEPQLNDMIQRYKKFDKKEDLTELKILLRRHARLRLYISTLLGAGLKVDHNFSIESVEHLMICDFKKIRNIVNDNPVEAASRRIDKLLEYAEQRIRDTTVCGWNYREGGLEKCLELLINGYLIEIVKELGIFFENNVSIEVNNNNNNNNNNFINFFLGTERQNCFSNNFYEK